MNRLAGKLQKFLVLAPPALRLRGHTSTPSFYVGAGDLDVSPHVPVASILLSERFPIILYQGILAIFLVIKAKY